MGFQKSLRAGEGCAVGSISEWLRGVSSRLPWREAGAAGMSRRVYPNGPLSVGDEGSSGAVNQFLRARADHSGAPTPSEAISAMATRCPIARAASRR